MWKIQYPTKDTTIYERLPELNVGSDEILELDIDGEFINRLLLDFDVTKIKTELESVYNDVDYRIYLRMFTLEQSALETEYSILANPITNPWNVGTGRRDNSVPTQDGASWEFRTLEDKWDNEGGDFDEDIEATQKFPYGSSPDIFMDVTNLFDEVIQESADFNGMIIRRSDENMVKISNLRFYGTNTHTVFPPQLILAFDDSEYFPQDAPVFDDSRDLTLEVSNIQSNYEANKTVRMRVSVRLRHFDRPFLEDFNGFDPIRLEEGSLTYQITDARTGTILVPFGSASKVSFDMISGIGWYFMVDLTSFQPRRFYDVQLRYHSPQGFTVNSEKQRFEVRGT